MTTPQSHATQVEVRWSDFDMYGHMMNANYIELAQEARLAFARDHFFSKGIDFIAYVRHLDVDYVLPLKWDNTAEVTVETCLKRTGNTSYVTRQEIKDEEGTVVCTIDCTQVVIDPDTQRPRPLTDKEREILADVPTAQ